MVALDLQYDILNNTPGDASPVEANFNRIEAFINTEVINRDGSTAMTAQLQLVGEPVAALDAAPKQYVDAVLPLGIIMMYGGTAAPPGGRWALCNGASLATVTYPDLFTILGYSFGGSAGNFSLPSFAGRFPIGPDTGIVHGGTGGNANSSVPAHTHTIDHDHGGFTSAVENQVHTHNGIDHLHPFSGSGATSADGAHQHLTEPWAFFFNGFDAQLDLHDGGGAQGYALSAVAGNTAGAHNHSVTVSGTTGAADRSLVTGVANQSHTHGVDVPAFAGSSGSSGDSGVGTNMPPWRGVTFIIRIA